MGEAHHCFAHATLVMLWEHKQAHTMDSWVSMGVDIRLRSGTCAACIMQAMVGCRLWLPLRCHVV